MSRRMSKSRIFSEGGLRPQARQNLRATAGTGHPSAACMTWTNAEPDTLMDRVLASANLKRSYQYVVSKVAPSAHGIIIADLAGLVKQFWPTLRA